MSHTEGAKMLVDWLKWLFICCLNALQV